MPFDDPKRKPDPFENSEAARKIDDWLKTPEGREFAAKLARGEHARVRQLQDLARRLGVDPNVESYLALRSQYWAAARYHVSNMTSEEVLKLSSDDMFALLEKIATERGHPKAPVKPPTPGAPKKVGRRANDPRKAAIIAVASRIPGWRDSTDGLDDLVEALDDDPIATPPEKHRNWAAYLPAVGAKRFRHQITYLTEPARKKK